MQLEQVLLVFTIEKADARFQGRIGKRQIAERIRVPAKTAARIVLDVEDPRVACRGGYGRLEGAAALGNFLDRAVSEADRRRDDEAQSAGGGKRQTLLLDAVTSRDHRPKARRGGAGKQKSL